MAKFEIDKDSFDALIFFLCGIQSNDEHVMDQIENVLDGFNKEAKPVQSPWRPIGELVLKHNKKVLFRVRVGDEVKRMHIMTYDCETSFEPAFYFDNDEDDFLACKEGAALQDYWGSQVEFDCKAICEFMEIPG